MLMSTWTVPKRWRALRSCSALGLILVAQGVAAQTIDCALADGQVTEGCQRPNDDLVVTMPVGENASVTPSPPVSASNGFSVRINGTPAISDSAVENTARRVDIALQDADVQVVFDGLGITRRLDMEVLGEPKAHKAGDAVTLQSALNYPAFVDRAEIRVQGRNAFGRRETISVIPVAPNGQVRITVPEGGDIVAIHRVYDANGRFDETVPIPLSRPDTRAQADDVEDGSSSIAQSRIPIHGGAITVSGSNLSPDARARVFGDSIRPDPSGGFVLQRIVPAGMHDVTVAIDGPGQRPFQQTRRVEIPKSDWFYAVTADLTFGIEDSPDTNGSESFDRGRLAGYVDGKTVTGYEITGSVDTGEGPLDEIFRDLDEKDPGSVLERLDPNDIYPTFGDDSTIVDNTPTDGKFYLRIAREGNVLQWGNFTSRLDGNHFVRNERTLYGLLGHWSAGETRANGEAIASVDIYAAQPDRLPQRDAFIGTGGSIYFLEKQDIAVGSETVTVEARDPVSGKVVGSRQLVHGVDYDVNYIQGVVTLAAPLQSGAVDNGLITSDAEDELALVVQYEFTPTSTDVDGLSLGGRAEVWATETLRFGVAGIVEQTGLADQTVMGTDLRYQLSEDTFLQFDYAESDGPGFGSTISADGGLIVDTVAGGTGSGRAYRLAAQADLAEIGLAPNGQIAGYFEERSEGFSSLDTTVTASTGAETLWGFSFDTQATDDLAFRLAAESYDTELGDLERTIAGEIRYAATERLSFGAAIEHLDRDNSTEVGTRTDAALRLTYALNDHAEIYGFAQSTLNVSGLDRNDRIGVGASLAFSNGWDLEGEVSDGSLGFGSRVLVRHSKGDGDSTYFGYELDRQRTLPGVALDGDDNGRFVVGGQRKVSDQVSMYSENSIDAYGTYRSLTNSYGLNYAPSERTTYSLAFEHGTVTGGIDNEFDRLAMSLGAAYQSDMRSMSASLEYRTDEGIRSGTDVDAETLLLSFDLTEKFSEKARLLASLDYATTETDQGSFLDGEFGEFSVGYAFRPINNDRLNLLARYRYLHDLYGQRVDDTDENGPRQRSHVLSIDGIYDLNKSWSLGGKVGYRFSESSPDETSPFTDNDARLLAASVTYHLPHKWDALIEARRFDLFDAGTTETGILAAGYRHLGNNFKVGIGVNFGSFSDDLTDLVQDDRGVFINFVAKF